MTTTVNTPHRGPIRAWLSLVPRPSRRTIAGNLLLLVAYGVAVRFAPPLYYVTGIFLIAARIPRCVRLLRALPDAVRTAHATNLPHHHMTKLILQRDLYEQLAVIALLAFLIATY